MEGKGVVFQLVTLFCGLDVFLWHLARNLACAISITDLL